jgi:DNA topoisomerase-1
MSLMKTFMAVSVVVLIMLAHLRTSRKKGSHPEKSHGRRSAGGKRILQGSAKAASGADKGRKLAAGKQKSSDLQPATDEDRKRLRIPPAWTDVRVSPDASSPLQAVGYDAKGREQRIYSPEHHERQAAAKFARIDELHERMPEIDKRLAEDAKTDDTALAALVIQRMGLRPGSDTDTGAEKKAHGATNLKASHVKVEDGNVKANFTGKKGVELDLSLQDPELGRLIKGRQEGKDPDDRLLDTDERKLRAYMAKAAPGVKPKDLRTYLGTSTARKEVAAQPVPKNDKEYKAARKKVGESVSKLLGNTPAIALNSYIAPSVFGPWDAARAK